MQVDLVLPCLLLALVGAARSSAATIRTVNVVLGRVALAYTATSTVALPQGADLRVLLALARHATEDGLVRLTLPALLQASDLGYGGRQHAALYAALQRLESATYTITRAPSTWDCRSSFASCPRSASRRPARWRWNSRAISWIRCAGHGRAPRRPPSGWTCRATP